VVDPTPLITSLYRHVTGRLALPVKNGPLQRQEIRPGQGEFAITNVRDGPQTASGGTRLALYAEGYFATHHPPDTTPTALLLAAVRAYAACSTWWQDPVAQGEAGLLSWTVDAANIFVNPLTNASGGTNVLTVETGFSLLLDLEVP
jgi:hypothetical protein